MARTDKYTIQRGTLNDIGDAIRTKRGYASNYTMTPGNMPKEIRGIKTGGLEISVGYKTDENELNELWPDVVNQSFTKLSDYITYFSRDHFSYYSLIGNSSIINSGENLVSIFNYEVGVEDSIIYLFYDTTLTANPWIGIYVESEGDWRIRRIRTATGDTEVSGSEIVFHNSGYYRYSISPPYPDQADDNYSCWLITGNGITKFGFCSSTNSESTSKPNNEQPCVFKSAWLPKLLSMDSIAGSTNPTELSWTTKWLLYENVYAGSQASSYIGVGEFENYGIRSTSRTWENATSLEYIDDHLTTTPDKLRQQEGDYTVPLSLDYLFSNCVNLRSVNLAQMFGSYYNDLGVATVSSMKYTFNNCHMLRRVVFEEFDNSMAYSQISSVIPQLDYSESEGDYEITPISMSHCFNNCYSLTDLVGMYNSYSDNLCVSDYSYCFNNCYSLKALSYDGSNEEYNNEQAYWFNTHYATTMNYMFANCYSLESFNIGDSWVADEDYPALENVEYMFYNCKSLKNASFYLPYLVSYEKEADLTYNNVRSLAHMFDGCISLKKVRLPFMLAGGDPVYSFAYMFANCISLEYVDVDEYAIMVGYSAEHDGRYAIEDISYMFYNCHSLKDLISSYASSARDYRLGFQMPRPYNTTRDKWNIKKMDHTFENCYSIDVLMLWSWLPLNASSYPKQNDATVHYVNEVDYTDALKNLKNLKVLNSSSRHINTSSTTNTPGLSLQSVPANMITISWYNASTSFGIYDCPGLTRIQIILIFNKLDTVDTTPSPVITIGADHLSKLSASDIAIATQKGWTVA